MSGDAYYPNVTLLLHCDGTDGSTTFTDSSPTPKTVTAVGNAHIETDQSKFGGASAYFDGTGDYLKTSAACIPASADFTVEFWVRLDDLSIERYLLAQSHPSNTNAGRTAISVTAAGAFKIFVGGTTPVILSTADSLITATNSYQLRVTKASNVYRLFIDGILLATSSSNSQTIEQQNTSVGAYLLGLSLLTKGFIDEIRITSGVARSTDDYTEPSEAFPNYAGQIAGIITDDASDPVARVVRAYRRDTGALVGNTTSSAADGSYSMNLLTLDQCSVIALDDASGDVFNDLIARVTPA